MRGESVEAGRSRRDALLRRIESRLETPMTVLAFAWLALLVVELVQGENRVLTVAGLVLWGVFILDFALKLTIAPRKMEFLRRNVLTILSLLLPALRLLRVARALRGLRLVRVLGSVNRGMAALGATLTRCGFGYVAALTVVVTLCGAAGMFAFEQEHGSFRTYGEALWWTAMIMTTMGSETWPRTVEGRILCILLALYAFAVFGYVTAVLATFFLGRDAAADRRKQATAGELEALRGEIASLRAELRDRTSPP